MKIRLGCNIYIPEGNITCVERIAQLNCVLIRTVILCCGIFIRGSSESECQHDLLNIVTNFQILTLNI